MPKLYRIPTPDSQPYFVEVEGRIWWQPSPPPSRHDVMGYLDDLILYPGTKIVSLSEHATQYLLSTDTTMRTLEMMWDMYARGGVEEVGEPEPTGEEPEALLGRIVAALGVCDNFPVGEDLPDSILWANAQIKVLRDEVRDLRARLASIRALASAEIDSDRDNVYIREED